MPFSDFEARLRRVQDTLQGLSVDRLPRLRAGIAHFEEQIATTVSGWGEEPVTATFSGTVIGCNSTGYPGATVTVTDDVTSAVLATLTCDGSGNYSGSLTFSGAGRDVTFTATATGTYASRFGSATPQSITLVEGANAVPTMAFALASTDYVCMTACGYFPTLVSSSYSMSDGLGAHTLNRVGTSFVWSASAVLSTTTYGADLGGNCVNLGVNNVPVSYSLAVVSGHWQASVGWKALSCNPGTGFEVRYSATASSISVSGTAADPCDDGPVTVTVPTASPGTGPGTAVPGGGGGLTFTP